MQAQLSAAQAYGNAPIEQRVRKMQADWAQLTQAVGQRSIDTAESFRRHSALIDEQLDIPPRAGRQRRPGAAAPAQRPLPGGGGSTTCPG